MGKQTWRDRRIQNWKGESGFSLIDLISILPVLLIDLLLHYLQIMFDYPSEILTHITGTFAPLMYMGPNVIRSLTFYTNKGKHGPYGDEQGPSFTNKINEGKIVGFLGREGLFLDAVGVHVMEGKVPPPKPSYSQAIIQSERTIAEIDNSPWSNKLVLARRGPVEEVTHHICTYVSF